MKECIMLGHGQSRTRCDYHCETWGCNCTYEFATRLDKLFIVDNLDEPNFVDFDKLAKVKTIITSVPYPNHPNLNIEVYPLQQVLAKFQTTFFSNVACYMIAYAILKEYERIYFYGIDMMTNSCYLFEKGAVEYWMGVAHILGVQIINTPDSCTGKTVDGKMYGYWPNGLGNTTQNYSKVLATETARFVKTAQAGMNGPATFDSDPDGHLALKFEAMRAAER